MSDKENLKQIAIDKIKEAFADTPPPTDWKIGYDWWEGEENNMETKYKGKHWLNLPFDLLFRYREKLPFMTQQGFRYYLPAYMLSLLVFEHKMDTMVYFILDQLIPPTLRCRNSWTILSKTYSYTERDDRYFEYYRAYHFTKGEAEAIFSFLEAFKPIYLDGEPEWAMQEIREDWETAYLYWLDRLESRKHD